MKNPEKCRGLVIGREPIGETSMNVHFLTDQHGLLKLRVKGGRQDYRRFGQAVDRLTLVNLELFTSHTGTHGLKETRIIETYPSIRAYFTEILAAYRIVEFYSALALPGGACFELFEGLIDILEQIAETAGSGTSSVLVPSGELTAFRFSGTGNDPSICCRCGNQAKPAGRFSRTDACFICRECICQKESLELWSARLQSVLHKLYFGKLDNLVLNIEEQVLAARYIREKFRFLYSEQVSFPALAHYFHYERLRLDSG